MFCCRLITSKIPVSVLRVPISRHVSNQEKWGHLVDEKNEISRWKKLNEKVFEPTLNGEEKRPAYVCHEKRNVFYSYKKLYIVSCLVRGLSVDEAIKQLSFVNTKGAKVVKDTILEAQELAVKEHNVEFKSNLWVAESFPEKGRPIMAYRRHARANINKIEVNQTHYFVRLEEGSPPEHYYYHRRKLTPQELMDEWFDELHRRKITNSL